MIGVNLSHEFTAFHGALDWCRFVQEVLSGVPEMG
jgi:hypothetical protein